MPGGLARVAALPEERGWAGLAGGLSKDTWVLASEPEPQSGLWLNRGPGLAALDPAKAMPARVAENLFWLGRYAERAEATVRLVRAILDRRNDFASGLNEPGAECLLGLFVALTRLSGTTDVEAAASDELDHGLLAVVSDPGRTGQPGVHAAGAAVGHPGGARPDVGRHLAGGRRPRAPARGARHAPASTPTPRSPRCSAT